LAITVPFILTLALSGLSVVGEGDCPRPEAVARRVDELVPQLQRVDRSAIAHLVRSYEGLSIRLQGRDGESLAERAVAARGSCEQLTETAAVVIAAWAVDLLGAEPASRRPVIVEPPPPDPDPERELALRWAAGVGLSARGGRPAPALAAWGTLSRWERWGAALSLTSVETRSVRLGEGRAHWRTFHAGAGPYFRITDRLEARAELVTGMAFARGFGFEQNREANQFELGGGATLSLEPGRSLPLWLALSGVRWLGRPELRVQGTETRQTLGSWDLLLTGGLHWGDR
jgi:hypothetical protein